MSRLRGLKAFTVTCRVQSPAQTRTPLSRKSHYRPVTHRVWLHVRRESWACWFIPIILACGRLRPVQSLGYTVSSRSARARVLWSTSKWTMPKREKEKAWGAGGREHSFSVFGQRWTWGKLVSIEDHAWVVILFPLEMTVVNINTTGGWLICSEHIWEPKQRGSCLSLSQLSSWF